MSKDIVNQRFINCIDFLLETKKIPSKSFISDIFGISNSKLSEILKKRMNVGVDLLSILTNEFPISSEWLLTGKGEMLKTPAKAEGPAQQVAETQEAYNKVAHLEEKIAFLQRENQLLQENKALLEDKVKSLKEKESRRIQELEEEIARLTQENHAIKSQPQDRAVG
ncbi:hypothetical protein [Riemerella columbipharyngis]|uniref:Bacteriophage CI repressor helix-turn-helix domain-containing protein n=1 Tax=Riemerella columbipharyngis TaxID=1071918 RepID=A0A1G7FB99_9FLAO|nr:hypothetical protein [Riemerella columbipharyngis]SDE73151.1 hypothetical protein SAMN05421544_12120 [Riemerella columbipharyngis]